MQANELFVEYCAAIGVIPRQRSAQEAIQIGLSDTRIQVVVTLSGFVEVTVNWSACAQTHPEQAIEFAGEFGYNCALAKRAQTALDRGESHAE